MNDSFYITLPSNVKNNFFDNTVANFKTKLAQRIELKGSWVVGLASISYTNSWYNLTLKGNVDIRYFKGDAKMLGKSAIIYPGRYDNIDDLIGMIKFRFSQFSTEFPEITIPSIDYEKKSKIVSIKLGLFNNRYVYPEFSENICKMLGFNKKIFDAEVGKQLLSYSEELNLQPAVSRPNWNPPVKPRDTKMHANKPYSLSIDFHSLYVYCDIVKHSFVGDSLSPLLRFVEIPPNYAYNEQVVCTYPDTHYIPLLTNEFESIEIAIRNDSGNLMPFEGGRSIVVLHFRKLN